MFLSLLKILFYVECIIIVLFSCFWGVLLFIGLLILDLYYFLYICCLFYLMGVVEGVDGMLFV